MTQAIPVEAVAPKVSLDALWTRSHTSPRRIVHGVVEAPPANPKRHIWSERKEPVQIEVNAVLFEEFDQLTITSGSSHLES
jgi:hypothetical protein